MIRAIRMGTEFFPIAFTSMPGHFYFPFIRLTDRRRLAYARGGYIYCMKCLSRTLGCVLIGRYFESFCMPATIVMAVVIIVVVLIVVIVVAVLVLAIVRTRPFVDC